MQAADLSQIAQTKLLHRGGHPHMHVSKRSLPVLGTAIAAREQCVFAVERDRPGRPMRLEGIVFELFGLVDRGFPRNSAVKIALNQTGLASGF